MESQQRLLVHGSETLWSSVPDHLLKKEVQSISAEEYSKADLSQLQCNWEVKVGGIDFFNRGGRYFGIVSSLQ